MSDAQVERAKESFSSQGITYKQLMKTGELAMTDGELKEYGIAQGGLRKAILAVIKSNNWHSFALNRVINSAINRSRFASFPLWWLCLFLLVFPNLPHQSISRQLLPLSALFFFWYQWSRANPSASRTFSHWCSERFIICFCVIPMKFWAAPFLAGYLAGIKDDLHSNIIFFRYKLLFC